jgi:uncharacterized protein (TIGR00661 family)
MKILYAIQGTGNGHISRARDIIPILQLKGEVDLLVSGTQADVELPYAIKYKFKGLSFIFGTKGNVDILSTYRKSNLKKLYKEIKSLPVENYDLVINDFEPVSAWACKLKNIPCIGLSHQAAVINKKSPKSKKADPLGKLILNNYAPVSYAYGFHFKAYDKNIFTPVIRTQIRNAVPQNKHHFTVYLPAYSDERIIDILGKVKDVTWEVFSKHAMTAYKEGNVWVRAINNDAFIESMINCAGVLCGGGFETPAEALFLKKKLMVIPMKGQYEQQCNAAALETMGVPVIRSLKKKYLEQLTEWTTGKLFIAVNYPDVTHSIIDNIIEQHRHTNTNIKMLKGSSYSVKKIKKVSLGKALQQAAG